MAPRNTAARDRHRRILARGKPPCHICGDDIDYDSHHLDPRSFTIDHVIPVARGGADELDNLAPAHRACNRTKSDSLPGDRGTVFETHRSWVA